MVTRKLTGPVVDRACGVLLGQAAGDALGVPYEFATPPPAGREAVMSGGGLGNYEPGEWSDDTQMATCIAQVAASGASLTDPGALSRIAGHFCDWLESSPGDIGNQTYAVLRKACTVRAHEGGIDGARMRDIAAQVASTRPSAGNGALMRTAVVALTALEDRHQCAAAAAAVAELTHFDDLVRDSCVLWTEMVRVAVLHGGFEPLDGLDLIPVERRDQWQAWIQDALTGDPATFTPNGYTVTAFRAALAVVAQTPVPDLDPAAGTYPAQALQHALHAAVRIGDDTDTVAAIAGGLLGALWGASAVPWHWRRAVHGWSPAGTVTARDLTSWATLTVLGGHPDPAGYPTGATVSYGEPLTRAVPHPFDDGVWLGTSNCDGHTADAVVSLCRVGAAEPAFTSVPMRDRVEVRLMDSVDPTANPHLEFVLADAAAAIAGLRAEGKTVLVHCVAAQQRTPSVAIAYARLLGVPADQSVAAVKQALHASVRGHGHVWNAATR